MTTISAEIVCDSVSPDGVRLTTMSLKYPRWIHAEIMTHRMLCRNASSSRAIPTLKMLQSILEDPAQPLHIGKNEKGMQAYEQITSKSARKAIYSLWNDVLRKSIESARDMHNLYGVAKQVINRLTEHSQHISVVVTATEWENLFALRCHPAAEPHFRALAWKMADLYYRDSRPTPVEYGQWHLPYVTDEEVEKYDAFDLCRMSSARCARTSYNNHDGSSPSPEKDFQLFERLRPEGAGTGLTPIHASPMEHQATPNRDDSAAFSGPLRGWTQFRKTLKGESMAFDYDAAVKAGWRDEALSILEEEGMKP